MPSNKIFLSYSRSDTATAIKIATQLRNEGADIWIDRLDIPPGSTWDFEIEKALGSCSCLLFISSHISVSSENVLNEVYYALEEKKKIVPIKIDDCKIPFRIRRLQHIDLSANYEDGFRALLTVLDLDKKQPANQFERENKNKGLSDKESEEELWRNAIQADTIEAYQNYVKTFPIGAYADKAISVIKKHELMREEKLWYETRSKNTIYSFQNYLKSTRLKSHSDEANKKIDELGNDSVKQNDEEENWKKAKKENTVSSYQNYLSKFENGIYKNVALNEIKSLRSAQSSKKSHSVPTSSDLSKIQNKSSEIKKSYVKLYIGAGLFLLLITIYFFSSINRNSSSQNNDIDATSYNSGLEYYKQSNYSAALEEFQKSADIGHGGAMYKIGLMYSLGQGASKNTDSSVTWFKRAAEADDVEAMLTLGNFYYNGDKTVHDYKKIAFNWYLQAAKAGNEDAMKKVSEMFYQGDGVTRDNIQGQEWAEKADKAHISSNNP